MKKNTTKRKLRAGDDDPAKAITDFLTPDRLKKMAQWIAMTRAGRNPFQWDTLTDNEKMDILSRYLPSDRAELAELIVNEYVEQLKVLVGNEVKE